MRTDFLFQLNINGCMKLREAEHPLRAKCFSTPVPAPLGLTAKQSPLITVQIVACGDKDALR
jgi:hypothetical protein